MIVHSGSIRLFLAQSRQKRECDAETDPVTHSQLMGLVDVAGIEPATPCLQSGKLNLSNLAGADVTRLKMESCDKTRQTIFSFVFRLLFVI